jgi:AcrR family transcriptional regulator
MARKTKQDWLIAGIHLLAAVGPEALTIEALCQRLGVTKGSFYHHFGSADKYKTALLAYFEQEGTLNIIEQVEETAVSPPQKLQRLLQIIVQFSTRLDHNPEIAIRAWARQDEQVRQVQERIDQQRLAYVHTLLRQILGDTPQADIHSRLLYALVVGSEQMQPPLIGPALQAVFDEYLQYCQFLENGP